VFLCVCLCVCLCVFFFFVVQDGFFEIMEHTSRVVESNSVLKKLASL